MNATRWELFGGASVFLHPVQCLDCDPLAPKEAMLTGTPVVACPNGGIKHTIRWGIYGYFADTVSGFVDRIEKAEKLDRREVRKSILDAMNPSVYVDEILKFCQKVINGERW